MNFTGKLNTSVQEQVDDCNRVLTSPARLEAVRKTGLMNTPAEAAFDRLTALAAEILEVPITLVTLIGGEKQFFKSTYGLTAPYDTLRDIPIDGSICRYTLNGKSIVVDDASVDPLLMFHPVTKPWGIVGFISLPMIDPEGHVLGTFCAIDSKKRNWSDKELRILRELTNSVMTEIDLRVKVITLETERDLREQFVATLTHDLRTPLTAAKMSAQLAVRKFPENKVLHPVMDRIVRSMDRADAMIRDLLDVNLMKAGEKVSLKLEECCLTEVVQTTIEEMKTVHGDRFLFQSDCSETEVTGLWDRSAVRRILENLIGNAVKYGSEERPVSIGLEVQNSIVRLTVHNEGNPISEAYQAVLFELYRRSDSASRGIQKGWGIGLTLVRGLTEALGGSVSVKSSPGEGTVFSVHLPRSRSH